MDDVNKKIRHKVKALLDCLFFEGTQLSDQCNELARIMNQPLDQVGEMDDVLSGLSSVRHVDALLGVKLLRQTSKMPTRATPSAAGFDLYSDDEKAVLPCATQIVATGIAVEIPHGFEGQIRSRSGLACNHGLHVLNSPGTIDSDYRGEILVILHNASKTDYVVKRGDRIAQLVITRLPEICLVEVDELSDTTRGSGRFGSTGK